jgi:hypothetical protein
VFWNDAWKSSTENEVGSEAVVVHVMRREPPVTKFPTIDVISRADAKGATRARNAQILNMASIV